MEKSESIAKLAKSLSILQSELSSAQLNATNPFRKNKYADLGSIIATVKPHLKAVGLGYSQMVSGGTDGSIAVTTILMHESGEWIASTAALPMGEEKGKSAAQVAGSVITYLRRYSLAAVLGVYAGDDDDGEAGKKTGQGAKSSEPAREPAPRASNGNGAQVPAAEYGSLEWAMTYKNSQGKLYGEMSVDELTTIVEHPKCPEDRKLAATLIRDLKLPPADTPGS